LKQLLGKEVFLEKPKDKKFGHYATPLAFTLAKEQRRPPFEIAKELAQACKPSPFFEEVEAVGGYVLNSPPKL